MLPFLGFWEKLPRPFFVLAPMANVTDTVFRRVIAKHGRPDVLFTEFVACDGLCSDGRVTLLRDLIYSEEERPLVAQVFGADPDHVYTSAKLIVELGFDGLDINMGCPDKSVLKQGAGAALIQTPDVAQSVIRAAKQGIADSGRLIPLSVKTRIGYLQESIDEWIPKLLETELAALTVHARTKKEMSKVPANWEYVKRVVELARGTGTLILGNGDVIDLADAQCKAGESGADGVMLGRAVFGNPWLFDRSGHRPTVQEKLHAMIEHARLFTEVWGDTKSMESFRKYACKTYAHGFVGASDLRAALMRCATAEEVETCVMTWRGIR